MLGAALKCGQPQHQFSSVSKQVRGVLLTVEAFYFLQCSWEFWDFCVGEGSRNIM